MPQALVPIFVGWGLTTTVATVAAYAVLIGGALALNYAANALFGGNSIKPEDGKFNYKQPVPSLTVLLGRNKHGGDYFFLEERGGIAWHGIVQAAHHIHGYEEFWLHDEQVTLDSNGYVTAPSHFTPTHVRFYSTLGLDAETAFARLITEFPEIWDADHRGDGLASILMGAETVSQEDFRKVYPQQMPQPTVVTAGHDRLYDPRTETYGFTENIALFRLFHLTQPHGGKLTLDDLYLPDWSHAADVCDQTVINRLGAEEPRYHGGLRYKYNSDQVQVGRWLDQAAELVVYERPDGKIGVHAGEYVAPDVRLTQADITAMTFDANRRQSSNVLAVRGRFTDPANQYSTTDAAIYGNPYLDEDSSERTKTVDNQVVRRHNHIQRLQKLAMLRANAPRVQITATYDAAKDVPYRRFVRVHMPPRLDEAVVEITGRPRLSLANLTIDFEGIVVPSTLYAFDAAIDEGVPGGAVVDVEPGGIPAVENFGITISTEVVTSGGTAAFATASWDFVSDALTYEVEWVQTAGGTAQSVKSIAGETSVRTGYLADGQEYKFRARPWSATSPGDWTDYLVATATADAVAPSQPTSVSGLGGAGEATISFTTPNSDNFAAAWVYHNTVDDFGSATLDEKVYLPPSTASAQMVSGLSVGTYYFWVTSGNWSDVESSPVATGAVTVS